jgi:ABC-type multidrug transport system ATPase subunit
MITEAPPSPALAELLVRIGRFDPKGDLTGQKNEVHPLDPKAEIAYHQALNQLDQLTADEGANLLLRIEDALCSGSHLNFHLLSFVIQAIGEVLMRNPLALVTQNSSACQSLIHRHSQSENLIQKLHQFSDQGFDVLGEAQPSPATPVSHERLCKLFFLLITTKESQSEGIDRDRLQLVLTQRVFPQLSFQMMMRLNQSLFAMLPHGHNIHLLILQHLSPTLDENLSIEMMSSLAWLRYKNQGDEAIERAIEHALGACPISAKQWSKIAFIEKNDPWQAPPQGIVIDGDQKNAFSWGPLGPSLNREQNLVVDFVAAGNRGELRFNDGSSLSLADGQEKVIDNTSVLYRSAPQQLALLPLVSSGLYVSNLNFALNGRTILREVSFAVKENSTLAIVGPSGCGKSTLLTILAGLLPRSSGELILGSQNLKGAQDLANLCTYIPQDDILFRELTVRENLESALRLHSLPDPKGSEARLNATIKTLGLDNIQDLKIGLEGEKGISGGQRKRVNIGCSTVVDMKPILLFDEPTSGLDPATDLEIMQLLHRLSREGHIVIAVTHNLSQESLAFFDQLLVLNKNGECEYFGKEQRAKAFYDIKSTHLLFAKLKQSSSQPQHKRFNESYDGQSLKKTLEEKLSSQKEQLKLFPQTLKPKQQRRPGLGRNLLQFMKRDFTRKSRDPFYLVVCLVQPILISFFIVWNFSGPLPNAIFSLLAATLWIGALAGVREINGELPQLKRDINQGASPLGFVMAKVLTIFAYASLQTLILASSLFLTQGYFSAPFSFDPWVCFVALCSLNLFGITLGLFISAAVSSTLAAVSLLPVTLVPLLILGGALLPHQRLQGLQWWAMKVNPLRVSFETMLYAGQNVLEPQFEALEPRSKEKFSRQQQLLLDYQEKLELFNEDPKLYRERYEKKSVNDIFAAALGGEVEESGPGPTLPPELEQAELLMGRPELWLKGENVLSCDPEAELKSLFRMEAYGVRSPQAFSTSLSSQGMVGMFHKQGGKSYSVYRPLDFWLIPMLEVVALLLMTYGVLRMKCCLPRGTA